MLIRYKQDAQGVSVPIATIYTPAEHGINPSHIDPDAISTVKKLKQSGAEAYIVGGAVRDLMLSRRPKDFDIATNASPRQIQRLFWNARIIGKRFKLVHLVFRDKVLEISTFRSDEEPSQGYQNIFGTIEQDAKRRDFSINSFYYDPTDGLLFDFNHAYEDFKKKKIRSVMPLPDSFLEDPVRMIRAIKYSVTTGFSLSFSVKMSIRRYAGELARTSTSRLTEEVHKILFSGYSEQIFSKLHDYRLFVYLLPCISVFFKTAEVKASLRNLDSKVQKSWETGVPVPHAEMIRSLVAPLVVFDAEDLSPEERYRNTFRQIKVLISPMTPPNYDIELAAQKLLTDYGFKLPKSVLRKQGQSARRPAARAEATPSTKRKKPVKPQESSVKTEATVHDGTPGGAKKTTQSQSQSQAQRARRKRYYTQKPKGVSEHPHQEA